MSKEALAVVAALRGAVSVGDYEVAKRMAGRCTRADQFALVDSIRAAGRRIRGF